MGKKLTKRAPKRKPEQELRRQNLEEPSSSQGQASSSRELSRLSAPVRKPSYPDTDSLFNIKVDTRKPIRLSRKERNEKRNAAKEHLDPSPRQEVASTSRGPSRPLANRQLSSCPTDGAKPSSPLQKRKKVLDPTLTKPHDTTDNLLVPKVGTMILRPKPVLPGEVHQSSKATKENEDPTSRKECASTSGGLSRPKDSSELSSPLQERKKRSHPSMTKRVLPVVVHRSSKASKENEDPTSSKKCASSSGGLSRTNDSSKLCSPLQKRKKVLEPSLTKPHDTTDNLLVPKVGTMILRPKPVLPGVVHQSSKASKENDDLTSREECGSTSGGLSRPSDSSKLSSPLQERKILSLPSSTIPTDSAKNLPVPMDVTPIQEKVFNEPPSPKSI